MAKLADQFGRYAELVPKDPVANVEFRRNLRLECAEDERRRETVAAACCRDPLFWINAFVWTYNPRENPSNVPFITWDFQDEALRAAFECFGVQDYGIEKSRDMGASWMILLPPAYHFVFGGQADFLVLSYKADLVDKQGDMSALLPKIDFIYRFLPSWMQPPTRRVQMEIQNLATGSVIKGETTTGNAGRGGRYLQVLLDEFAAVEIADQANILGATADTTKSRAFNSTPNGAGNSYYDLIHRPTTRKIRMHWSQHPDKKRGLYQGTSRADFHLKDDTLTEFVDYSDPEQPVARKFPDEYPFVLDGKLRSVWYDAECVRRANNEQEIAKELDIDYHSSDYVFFPGELIERCIRTMALPPKSMGELEFEPDSGDPIRFTEGDGIAKLWCLLDQEGKPPPARYGVGADVAMGTGATPSTIVVANLETGEKVAEFSSPAYSPDRWGTLLVAVARWFRDGEGVPAKAIWEANGPGRALGNRVMGLGLPHVYWRTNETSDDKKQTKFAGWWNNQDSATLAFNEYRAALNEGRFLNRSAEALGECRQYIITLTGGSAPVHSGSTRKVDPTGARENHGDLVVADVLVTKLLSEQPSRMQKAEVEPSPHSVRGRMLAAQREQQQGMFDDPAWAPGGVF